LRFELSRPIDDFRVDKIGEPQPRSTRTTKPVLAQIREIIIAGVNRSEEQKIFGMGGQRDRHLCHRQEENKDPDRHNTRTCSTVDAVIFPSQ